MDQNQESELRISDYLNGLLTEDQEKELIDWVHSSKENAVVFYDCCARWELSLTTHPDRKFRVNSGWRKLAFRIDPGLRYRLFFREYGRIAAIFILAFLLGVSVFKYGFRDGQNGAENSWIVNETPYGSKSVLTLPDGSRVWLNAGSKIRYAGNFNRKKRELFLEGEAYFQVQTNPKKPFNVNAAGISIKATGTKFNVRAYSDENFIETTLIEGKVVVNRQQAGKEPVEMKPSQKLTFFKNGNTSVNDKKTENEAARSTAEIKPVQIAEVKLSSNVETAVYTSWKDEEWIIQHEKFSSLAVKLQRRYDVLIKIDDERVKDFSYSGKLKDETLEQVMNVICQTSPLSYKVNGKTVNVWFNEKYNKN